MSEAEELQTVTLGNGVCLRVKKFPPFLIRQAIAQIQKPKPPKIELEGKGEEENPDDPIYKEALEEYELATTEKAIDTMLVAGTEVVSVPDGIYPPDEVDNWAQLLDFLGVTFDRENKFGLYLTWLKLYVLSDPSDMELLMKELASAIGLSEEEVDQAVESFRGGKVGGSDNGSPSEDSGHRDNVPKNRAQRRARSRGKGSS